MLIGILSDTHRNSSLHQEVLDLLVSESVERIYHLGDDYPDGELEISYGIEILRVPGLYCPEYQDRHVENVVFDSVHGVNIVMAHDIKDIHGKDIVCNDIILSGHTHKSELRIENGKLYMNPGHLKGPKDKGRNPSYGLLEIDFGTIQASIIETGGSKIASLSLRKDETGLFKV